VVGYLDGDGLVWATPGLPTDASATAATASTFARRPMRTSAKRRGGCSHRDDLEERSLARTIAAASFDARFVVVPGCRWGSSP